MNMARKSAGGRSGARAGRATGATAVVPFELNRWASVVEVLAFGLIILGLLTLVALFSRDAGDLGNAWILLLRRGVGAGVWILAVLFILGGMILLLRHSLEGYWHPRWQAIVGSELMVFAWLGLAHVTGVGDPLDMARAGQRGGYIGWALYQSTVPYLGTMLSGVLFTGIVLGGLYMVIAPHWPPIGWRIRWAGAWIGMRLRAYLVAHRAQVPAVETVSLPSRAPRPRPATMRSTKPLTPAPEAVPAPRKKASRTVERKASAPRSRASDKRLPPIDLLVADEADNGDDADARHKAEIITETLDAFGIPAQVVEWHRGPVVTQFGVEPGFIERQDRDGTTRRIKIRVNKILSLTNDLALALAAAPIRIEAPVPGRSIVGIEVPNAAKSVVGLRGVIEAPFFRKVRSGLAVALGRDVSGDAVIADLSAMPHLLIAGATGSGKSVCLNSTIVSLLYQNTPDQLKLLLIDPKRVELTRYNGIPHLVAPVVVDVDKVISALRWVTREMERRYKEFAQAGARDLAGYNPTAESRGVDPLPKLVVIIDELADLMMAAPDDVERTICRLAQMARATGIHLVIATQRPSVDVVTGLIKANFPARISFAVTSQVDSRVILDTPGAEKLLGRGDMLFMAPDSPKLQRIQGCWVSEREVDELVSFLRQQWAREITEAVEAADGESAPWDDMDQEEDASGDDLVAQAIELVRQHEQASASFLQRQMRIGYPRAARLIDELEALGIVGPPESGGRSRVVLDVGDSDDEEDDFAADDEIDDQ